MMVIVPEATNVCQDEQICAGLKPVTDGALHGVQAIWDEKLSTEDRVVLLVDTNNTFNEMN